MKRIIALISIAIIALCSFAGCGNNNDGAVGEAEKLVTDASESLSSAVSDMMDNSDGNVTNETNSEGDVTNETNDNTSND